MICITGLGVLTSIGNKVSEYTKSLKMGISGIKNASSLTPHSIVPFVAEFPQFSFQDCLKNYSAYPEITQKALVVGQRASLGIQASILCALEAWNQANGINITHFQKERVGVIICGHNLTNNLAFSNYKQCANTPEYVNPRYATQFMDSDYLGTITEMFNIHGSGATIGGASASGNVGLIKGFEAIRSGSLDICIVVAPPANLGPLELQGFYNLGAMGGKKIRDNPEKVCRPFDKDHQGFIYGEGCGCMILEAEKSAKERGIKPIAEFLGGAIYLDGNRLSNPNVEGEIRAMQIALKNTEKKPEDIEYINTHGTASPLGDETEIRAIKRVFGGNIKDIWLNATKGLIGHCIYSAGLVEAITTIIQMKEGFLHPNKNLDNPIDNECRFCSSKFEEVAVTMAMSNSFGFGGINSSIILKI